MRRPSSTTGFTEPPPAQIETELRRDLAACFRLAADFGWDDLIATHFSVRLPGEPAAFLINPMGLLFEQVTASSLQKVDLQGNLLEPSEYPLNRPGALIHGGLHQARADVHCVMHLHSRDGVAVASTEAGLLPLNQNAMIICDDIAYHEFEGVVADLGEQARLQQHLVEHDFMLLRNHGTLVVGANIPVAFYRLYLLETACTVQVRTLAMNTALHEVPQTIVERVAGQVTPAMLTEQAPTVIWPTLLSKVERLYPDFKD